MVTDQEPRYRLVDADGNVVGSLFAETDGTLKLQEGTSGNDNELSLTTQGALEVEQIETGGTVHVAANAAGGDADARLDSVLSQASDGDRIILENEIYTKDRTINEFELIIESTGQAAGDGAKIDATWTIKQDRNHLRQVRINSSASVIFDGAEFGSYMSLSQIFGSVTIKADNSNHLMFGVHGDGSVTFESGCTGSTIMAAGNLTVTDNDGSNTIL